MRRLFLLAGMTALGIWLRHPQELSAQLCSACDPSGSLEAQCVASGGNWNANSCSCSAACDQSGASSCYLQNGSWNSLSCTCALPPPPQCYNTVEYTYTSFCSEYCDQSLDAYYNCCQYFEDERTVDCHGNTISETSISLGGGCEEVGGGCAFVP